MSPNQRTQSEANPLQQNVPAEGAADTDLLKREIALVKLYQELTGEDESHARGAFMYVLRDDWDFKANPKT